MKLKLRHGILLSSFLLFAVSFLPVFWEGGNFLRKFFRPICHEEWQRCFWICETPTILCARCMSIYLLLGVGSVLNIQFKIHAKTFFLTATTLMFMDVSAEMLGLYENVFATRMVTGGLFGLAISIVFNSE